MKQHNTSIQKQYQQYLIKLSSDSDLVNIIIEKENTIYESNLLKFWSANVRYSLRYFPVSFRCSFNSGSISGFL